MPSSWSARVVAERLVIAGLGAGGDGIAETAQGPLFVPGALPGEAVVVERSGGRGRIEALEQASPERIAPFCPYFGTCGGCVAQHIGPRLYDAWKRHKVVEALRRAGLDAAVEPLVDAHGEGRRRITFHARQDGGTTRVGFMEAKSHHLVEIEACPVAVPGLGSASYAASTLARRLADLGKPLDLAITSTSAGLDIDLRGSGPVDARRRTTLIETAGSLDLARLSLHGDVLIERRRPFVMMGRAEVVPSPGAFLQATAAGEAALASEVVAGAGKARRVADLFAGCGPFTLRLAEAAEVHAVESDEASLAALDRAARMTAGLRRVTVERRDLFRRPLLAPEPDRFDAVVLDPPRAGAEAQARQLGLSSVDTVILVSCDPGTFARDAAILAAGGYRLERVVPIDQFKWAAHVEVVGLFRKPHLRRAGKRKGRAGQG